MGRAYAGIVGPLAFLTVLARELNATGGVGMKLYHAWLALVAFAALGYVVGWLASWIIEDSVRAQFSAELAEQKSPGPGQPQSAAPS